jgi:hypothetical protein
MFFGDDDIKIICRENPACKKSGFDNDGKPHLHKDAVILFVDSLRTSMKNTGYRLTIVHLLN